MSARRQQSTRRVGRIERLEPRQLLAVDTVLDFSIPRDLPPGHDVFAAIWGQKQSDNEYLVLQQQAQRPGDYAFVPVSPVSLPQPINVSTLTDTQLRLPLTAVESAGFGGIVGGVVVLFVAPERILAQRAPAQHHLPQFPPRGAVPARRCRAPLPIVPLLPFPLVLLAVRPIRPTRDQVGAAGMPARFARSARHAYRGSMRSTISISLVIAFVLDSNACRT